MVDRGIGAPPMMALIQGDGVQSWLNFGQPSWKLRLAHLSTRTLWLEFVEPVLCLVCVLPASLVLLVFVMDPCFVFLLVVCHIWTFERATIKGSFISSANDFSWCPTVKQDFGRFSHLVMSLNMRLHHDVCMPCTSWHCDYACFFQVDYS